MDSGGAAARGLSRLHRQGRGRSANPYRLCQTARRATADYDDCPRLGSGAVSPHPTFPCDDPVVKGRLLVSPLSDAPDTPRPAAARPEGVVVGSSPAESRYRFTVLTSRLIRMELSPTGVFTDAATQLVVSRDLGEPPSFRVVRGEDRLEIITEHLHLVHVPSLGFSPSGLSVRLRSTALHVTVQIGRASCRERV